LHNELLKLLGYRSFRDIWVSLNRVLHMLCKRRHPLAKMLADCCEEVCSSAAIAFASLEEEVCAELTLRIKPFCYSASDG
jgi:hypothetical protein